MVNKERPPRHEIFLGALENAKLIFNGTKIFTFTVPTCTFSAMENFLSLLFTTLLSTIHHNETHQTA